MWEGPIGTVAVVGVSTKEATLQCHGYTPLIGADDQSWGWNLVDNHLLHNGDAQGTYPSLNNAPKYQIGERVRVILDCDDNTLSFEKNYRFLGVAFRGKYYFFIVNLFLNCHKIHFIIKKYNNYIFIYYININYILLYNCKNIKYDNDFRLPFFFFRERFKLNRNFN